MGSSCSAYGDNAYRVLVETAEGGKLLEKPWCRLEYIIKMNLREIGWGCFGLDSCAGTSGGFF
jgi:hypothetical protein